MQTIQQLIDSISIPKGVTVIGLTTPTTRYQLDINQQRLDKLIFEPDLLGQVFPRLVTADPNKLDISEVTHLGYIPAGKKKAKIVTPKIVEDKLSF